MAHILGAAAFLAAVAPLQGEAKEERLVLPSGLEAELQEVLVEGDLRRYRFVAPAFRREMALDVIAADLEHLCQTVALPDAGQAGAEDARFILSLADKPSEFGVSDPGVVQVFEAYRVEDGLCIWEVF